MPDTYTCNHCGHTWTPRIDRLPVRCPKCQSTRWNTRQDNGPTVEQQLLEACKASLDAVRTAWANDIDNEQAWQTVEKLKAAIARAEKEG